MNNVLFTKRGRRGGAALRGSTLGVAIALVVGVLGLSAGTASAAGTSTNTISAKSAPSAGSAHGTYTPSATATSGDQVGVSLDKSSSGCSLSDAKVTFTGDGTCVVDFNDPGNNTYAAAPEVTQSIKVYSSNDITTSAFPSSGSVGGSYAPGASATSGDTVVITTDKYSTGCYLSGGWVHFSGSGTCKVDFNDPGNGAFAAADQVQRTATVHSANTIYPSTPPAAGTVHGTYTPTATATSGDKVEIGLSGSSSGCSLSDGKVTFTGNGVCVVEFNDAGNGAFAAAAEVKQSITVGSGNPQGQAALTITSTSTTYQHVLTLTSVGGSGTGATTYSLASAGTAECIMSGDALTSVRAGTCEVTATKAGDGTYAATSVTATITVAAPAPTAVRLSTPLRSGRIMTARIIGSGFYGRPLVVSDLVGTSAVVTHDNGRSLTIRVLVASGSRSGRYRFTIVFAHGQRTSLRYRVV
jgi:hypothetical protein